MNRRSFIGTQAAGTIPRPGDGHLSRRCFLASGAAAMCGFALSCGTESGTPDPAAGGIVRTVLGPVSPGDLGFTLPHEHVIVDWNGGDGKSMERYDPDEAFRIMLPYLTDVRDMGVRTLVDCSPPWLGRDALLLLRLSDVTGMHIVTPTGLYEQKNAPPFAFEASMEEIRDFFVRELEEGIRDTGIRPGFIKIGVSNEGPVTANDEKIVIAACHAHKQTGATINSHTFQGSSALRQLDILDREGVNPAAFTYMHAGFEDDFTFNREAARRGCWIEYDSIRADTAGKHLTRITTMLDEGFGDRLLMSQDRGWYTIGQPEGGAINPYTYLPQEFLPLLESKGVSREEIHTLTVVNPGRSYAIEAASA